MGQLVLTMKYRKNTGMMFNPTEIFFFVPVRDNYTGW